jgi:hypothetical protein
VRELARRAPRPRLPPRRPKPPDRHSRCHSPSRSALPEPSGFVLQSRQAVGTRRSMDSTTASHGRKLRTSETELLDRPPIEAGKQHKSSRVWWAWARSPSEEGGRVQAHVGKPR